MNRHSSVEVLTVPSGHRQAGAGVSGSLRGAGRHGRRQRRVRFARIAVTLAFILTGTAASAEEAVPPSDVVYCAERPAPPAFIGPMQSVCIRQQSFDTDLCDLIETLSDHYALPAGFFTRLIWQESRFDPNAVSPAGARGIAQFIASTARLRALRDPYNPAEALIRSAEYLAEMRETFGNLGLAAIGYNAGEARARSFLAGNPFMPGETRHYVRVITGNGVETWRDQPPQESEFALADDTPFRDACLSLAANRRISPLQSAEGEWKPWGVQLGSHFSRDAAAGIFERVKSRHDELAGAEPLFVPERNRSFGSRARFAIRVGHDTREESQALCNRIRNAGGFCLVVRNP